MEVCKYKHICCSPQMHAACSGLQCFGTERAFAALQEQIKGLITNLMLSTPAPVRSQLSEALTIIGRHDFPAKWMTLLPEFLERLKTGDAATAGGVLETANSIFKRYRCPPLSLLHARVSCHDHV